MSDNLFVIPTRVNKTEAEFAADLVTIYSANKILVSTDQYYENGHTKFKFATGSNLWDEIPYVDFENVIVRNAAGWAADSTVYNERQILINSDETYDGTNCRKVKIADGLNTFASLDYLPAGEAVTIYNGDGSIAEYRIVTIDSLSGSLIFDSSAAGFPYAMPPGWGPFGWSNVAGLVGGSDDGYGLYGFSENSIAIYGSSDNVGVWAQSNAGIAFVAEGLMGSAMRGGVVVSTLPATKSPMAVLDIQSTTQGFLPPRMTTAERNTLGATLTSLENGMIVRDINLGGLWEWNSPDWIQQ